MRVNLQKITARLITQYGDKNLEEIIKLVVLEGVKLSQRKTRLTRLSYCDLESSTCHKDQLIECQLEQQAKFKKLIKEID